MAEQLLKVEDLQVSFATREGRKVRSAKAVDHLSFTIGKGERVAIVGESGSGKSTTAHALINLLPGTGAITGGNVTFSDMQLVTDAKVVPESTYIKIRGSRIGLVPQDPMSNLNPVWKIGFQVKEALVSNGFKGSKSELTNKAVEVLEKAGFENASKRLNAYPHEFSGGQLQRVLIAIGLANTPDLLIADEPTSALDVTVQKVILDHLDSLTRQMCTSLLFITHDLGLAAERADKLIVMYKGQVVESGSAREVLNNPRHPYTQRLIAAAPSIASTRLESVKARQQHGQDGSNISSSQVLIEAKNLIKEYTLRGSQKQKFKAVDDVSFTIERGTTLAVVGESGSGKSTVANMLLALTQPTSGTVLFQEEDVFEFIHSKHSHIKRFRKHVQPVFQNPYGSLDPMFSIGRAIEEPLKLHKVGTATDRSNRVHELLELVQLPKNLITRYPAELSGGQRQRVAIARALALNPELIVCDEAVSALDVIVQQQILTLLNDLQAETGVTYLFITHDLAVVRLVADQAIVMQKGRIVERGTTEAVFNSPQEQYTINLLNAIPGHGLF